MFLSVIIPAYNEEKRLLKTLFSVDGYLRKQSYQYEIIVVDDGSMDNTTQITKNAVKDIANLKLILNPVNHGKGFVVRKGLLAAQGDYRLFMDADNSTSIDQLDKFIPELKKYDIFIASRAIKGAVVNPPQPFLRRSLGKLSKFLIHTILWIWDIKDTQCGFKLFSKKAVEDILPKCVINGWVFDAEILKIAKKRGYLIKEVPVIWKNELGSKVSLKSYIKTLFELLEIRYNLVIGRY